jgi:hypothetical protein
MSIVLGKMKPLPYWEKTARAGNKSALSSRFPRR